jgi:hypothetical protein
MEGHEMFHIRCPFGSLGHKRVGVERDHYAEHDNAQLPNSTGEKWNLVE